MQLFFILSGVFFIIGILGFAVTSFIERERHAGYVALLFAAIFAGIWFGSGYVFPTQTLLITCTTWSSVLLGTFILSLPIGKTEPLKIDTSRCERYDERDVIFGRMELRSDTWQYEEYYSNINPDVKKFDDHLRELPSIGDPGGIYAHPLD